MIFDNEHPTLTENQKTVLGFLRLLEDRRSINELDRFYHPNAEQVEYPNAVVRTTVIRNLADLKAGAERGRQMMSSEEYEVKALHDANNVVILEAVWRGTVTVPIGSVVPGEQIAAHFAQFFEFRDGKIFRQRNYDCFRPFD